jgi:hypothetical protein
MKSLFIILYLLTHVAVAEIDTSLTLSQSSKFNIEFEISTPKFSANLDGIAWSQNSKNLRIDFSGPFGIQVGSFLWSNQNWQMYIPSKNLVIASQDSIIPLAQLLGQKDTFSLSMNSFVSFFCNDSLTDTLFTQNQNSLKITKSKIKKNATLSESIWHIDYPSDVIYGVINPEPKN